MPKWIFEINILFSVKKTCFFFKCVPSFTIVKNYCYNYCYVVSVFTLSVLRSSSKSPPQWKGEKRNTIHFLSSPDAKQANQLVALVVWSVRSIERFSSRMRLVPLHVRPWRWRLFRYGVARLCIPPSPRRWLGEGVILCQPQRPLTMTPRNAKGDETGCV